jgi:TolB-like protein
MSDPAGGGGRWALIEEIYGQAIGLPEAERGAFLDAACGEDAALRAEVADLLDADAGAETFFEQLGEVVRAAPAEALALSLPEGSRVGSYEILGELGRGGMGVVYRARDVRLGRLAALKFLPALLSSDSAAKERLVAEAKAASASDHPNIATLYEIGEAEGGSLYLAMACHEGQTLKDRLASGPLPLEDATDIARQVAEGLAAAHRRNVVHCDIKPANVFITEDGLVKILDFGVARVAAAETAETGRAMGTVAYMSPEQTRGGRVDHRTDLWSLGVLLYEMVAGRHPFQADDEATLVRAILKEEPAPLVVEPGLGRVVARLLAKIPADRHASAGEVARELATWSRDRGTAGRSRRTRRTVSVAALAIAALVAGAFLISGLGERDTATAAESSVAILPFEVRSSPEHAYLGEGMVNLLSGTLDGAGDLRVVAPHIVLSRWGEEGRPEDAARFAGSIGAGRYIVGEIVGVEGRLRIQASLYDRSSPAEPIARATVEGGVDRIFNLVDELSTQLMLAPFEGPSGRLARAAAVTTTSLDAFKAYLEGERALRAGDFGPATQAFQQAVAADSTFALAHYRLAQAAGWDQRYGLSRESVEAALRHAERLAPHERLLVEAFHARMRRDVNEAERLYYRVLEERPDDVEAWQELGEALFHSNYLRGRSRAEARRPLERALRFDPGHTEARFHLLELAAWDGRRDAFEALFTGLAPQERASLEWRALRAFAFGDSAVQGRILGEMGDTDDRELYRAVLKVAVFARDPATAARLAQFQVDAARLPEQRQQGRLLLARIELARGRPGAARAEIARVAELDPGEGREHRALLAALPFVPVDSAELQGLRRDLTEWRAEPGASTILREYLLGLTDVRDGHAAAALARAGALAAMRGTVAEDSLARGFAGALRAYVALREGRPAEALARLDAPPGAVSMSSARVGAAFYARTLERYLKAEALHALGRDDEALGWYRSIAEHSSHGLPYLGPAVLREGEHQAREGDHALAAQHYRRFLEMWRNAEAELQPLVRDARLRLSAAVGERPSR